MGAKYLMISFCCSRGFAWEQRANASHFGKQKKKLSRAFPNSEKLIAAMNEVVLLAEELLTLACPLLPVLSWNAGRLQNKSVVFLGGQENKTFSFRNVKCSCRKPSSSDRNKNTNGISYGFVAKKIQLKHTGSFFRSRQPRHNCTYL